MPAPGTNPAPRSDLELVDALNERDARAFDVLYLRYRDWVVALAYRFTGGRASRELADEIKQVAIDYSLMSEFTAFLAVDASRRTEGTHGTTVSVPALMPEGVRYDTTVSER